MFSCFFAHHLIFLCRIGSGILGASFGCPVYGSYAESGRGDLHWGKLEPVVLLYGTYREAASKFLRESADRCDSDNMMCLLQVLIKGETDHYDMIKDAATQAIMNLGVETGIPILCGIMGCHNLEQVEARAT